MSFVEECALPGFRCITECSDLIILIKVSQFFHKQTKDMITIVLSLAVPDKLKTNHSWSKYVLQLLWPSDDLKCCEYLCYDLKTIK